MNCALVRLVTFALCMAAAPLGAQQLVRGVVLDSILRSGGLSGAEVVVVGTALWATTDEAGRFDIEGVMPGRYTLLVSHSMLDSLALPDLEAEFEVRADEAPAPLRVSTPTLGAFQLATCGRTLAPHEAIVLGGLSDPDGRAVPAATVTAQWVERVVGKGSSDQHAKEVVTTVGAGTHFALCGVPREPAVRRDSAGAVIARSSATLRATAGDLSTAPLVLLPVNAPVVRHDLVVGSVAAEAVVRGRLIADDGRAIDGARVSRTADTATLVRSDSDGRFSMRVPRRSEQLLVRAVGRAPMSIEFAAGGPDLDLGETTIPALAFQLAEVEVVATLASRERREFDERRAAGLGTFIDDEEVKRLPRLSPNIVGSRVPRSMMLTVEPGDRRFVFSKPALGGTSYCEPRFFVDAQDMGILEGSEQEYFLAQAVRVEAYTAQFVPPRFSDFDGCGAVVIWTR